MKKKNFIRRHARKGAGRTDKKLSAKFYSALSTALIFLGIAVVMWIGSGNYNPYLAASIPEGKEAGIIQLINENDYTGVIIKDSDNSAINFEDPGLAADGIDVVSDTLNFNL